MLTNKVRVSVIKNTLSITSSTAVTSAMGFFYWWIAAHFFSPQAVGSASAAISAMLLIGTAGMFGMGTLLIGELPRRPGQKAALLVTALLVVGGSAFILGLLFALLASWLFPDLKALSNNVSSIFAFGLGVSLTGVVLVTDEAMVGILRSDLQLFRNAVFAISKLVFLLALPLLHFVRNDTLIFITWQAGNLVSLGFLVIYFLIKGVKLNTCQVDWKSLSDLGRPACAHHALNLTLQAPGMLMPVLVTLLLSAAYTAYFYISWMIAGFLFVIPGALATVLYAVSAAEPEALAARLRFTLRLSFTAGLLAWSVLFLGADLGLQLFGADYATNAGWCLRILGFAVFPIILKVHYVALARVRRRAARAAKWMAVGGLFEVVLASLGAQQGGLVGLALGWVIALIIEAALLAKEIFQAARAPEVLRKYDPEPATNIHSSPQHGAPRSSKVEASAVDSG